MNTNRFVPLRYFFGVALAVFVTGFAAHAAQPGNSSQVAKIDAANDLSLIVGRSVLLDTAQPVQRVAVGVGDFAEATVITPTEIMVNAKTVGETTIILWESGGNREFFNVTIRPSVAASTDRLEGIRREMRTQLPGQDVFVSQENGSVFLRGTVHDLNSSDRAVQIASVAGKVVNLLNVNVPNTRPQILLKCNFASLDRSKSRQLGVNMFNNGLGHWVGSMSTQQYPAPLTLPDGSMVFGDDLNLFTYFPGLDIGATIQALEQQNILQTLAEPNVLTEDGTQGSILAGGEYPYPVPQGSLSGATTITIQFKEYGIRLIFVPHITPQGTIDLQVVSEVSALDFTNAVTISGFRVPAITERRVKTEVNLSKGQSFAIGGLLDNSTSETLQKIPFIGDVPILGKFFQSINKTKNNSELIVVVTPEIVQPAAEGTIPNPKWVQPFMTPNSPTPMHHPDGTANSTATVAPAPPNQPTMPVEQLVQQQKIETILDDTNTYKPGTATGSAPAAAPQQ